MNTGEIVALASAIIIIGLALFYIVRSKRSGKKCIGCPYADTCSKGCGCPSSNKK